MQEIRLSRPSVFEYIKTALAGIGAFSLFIAVCFFVGYFQCHQNITQTFSVQLPC